MIDLHTHSTASDGTLTPAELVALAEELPLEAIALTDHDTTSGLEAFLEAGAGKSVKTVPGVEVAASWYGGSLHIVGLHVQPESETLNSLLQTIRQNREIRNRKILDRLGSLGIKLTYEEVQEAGGDHVIGRPHFAAALIRKGVCSNPSEAFQKYLGRDAAAYVPRYLPLPEEAIRTVHEAGGLAIWAHPAGGPHASQPARIRQVARHLKRLGLDGVELFYPDHSEDDEHAIRAICGALDLAFSGGSDFHGGNMPGIELGTGRGTLNIPLEYLTILEQRLQARRG